MDFGEGWIELFSFSVFFYLCYLGYLNYQALVFWKKRNIPYYPAKPFFTKAALTTFLVSHRHLRDVYYHSKNDLCVGFYQFRKPTLLLKNPRAINLIFNRDFKNFIDKRSSECTEGNEDPLSQHLLALSGYKWSYLRNKLTPSFTPEKLKNMFPVLEKCVDNFISEIANSLGTPVEVKGLCGRLSMDCIASCAFGLELNCLKNENETFIKMSSYPFKSGFLHNLKSQIRLNYPNLFKKLSVSAYNKDVKTFFCSIVDKLIQLKKETEKPYVDFVYALMKLLEKDEVKNEGSPFTIGVSNLIAAQVFSFFVGGFETTSITMGNVLFELGRHEEVRERLRDEIDTVIGDKEVTYDKLNSMKYLGCVLDEVLRLYPAVYYTHRVSAEDYRIPGTDVTIEKGMELVVPILEIHNDPANFPEPSRFLPERFGPTNRAEIPKGAYIPFGDGPRHCIGFRFSLLELKLSLVKLLKDYDFTLDPKTPSALSFEEYSRIYKVEGNITLKFTKRVKN